MILNIAGSGGAGKTYIAKKLLELSKAQPIGKMGRSRPLGYIGRYAGWTIGFVGPYTATCGGLDAVGSVDNAEQMIRAFADHKKIDIVFYEGLMVGKSVGRIGEVMKNYYNKRHVKAFLDTPLPVCIDRVMKRRKASGNNKPLDPKNLILDHRALGRSRINSAAYGLRCVDINYKDALNQVLKLLRRPTR